MLFSDHINDHSETMHIYTDGSKSETGVGCAAVLPTRILTTSLPKHATIFTTELKAILITLKEIPNLRNRN